jgi:ABC-type branched-subunit amino acid transport system ATPase component
MGITVLLVEHHMSLVMSVSDHIVALNFGKKIAEGTPEHIQQHPDVIAAYLGSPRMRPRMAKLFEVKKLSAFYGATQVLFDIDFAIDAGKITTILGANGAGKTTTLRALCQIVRTTGSMTLNTGAGDVQLVGKSTDAIVRMGVAHVPDGRGTFTTLSVEENLRWAPTCAATRTPLPRTSSTASSCSRGCASGVHSRPARCRVASSRCWPSAAR